MSGWRDRQKIQDVTDKEMSEMTSDLLKERLALLSALTLNSKAVAFVKEELHRRLKFASASEQDVSNEIAKLLEAARHGT